MRRAAETWLLAVVAAASIAAQSGDRTTRTQGSEPSAAGTQAIDIEATPGTIVRWSVPGTRRCGMGQRSWSAIQETCYYPIDLERRPGTLVVTRRGAGGLDRARIRIIAVSRGSQSIQLGDIPQANPSPADISRHRRESVRVGRLWRRAEGPALFTLPLGAPLDPLPEGQGFGSLWVFNTTPETTELHSGADFAAGAGTPVTSAADGTVVMADEHFFAGNSVFVDHGGGLVTMYFHLSEIVARPGQELKKGQRVGLVGSTGRSTGPHLHFGVRWHGARVDPTLLLGDPAKIPAIGDR